MPLAPGGFFVWRGPGPGRFRSTGCPSGRVSDTLHGVDFASTHPSRGAPAATETGRALGVIPARLGSSRLPRKPLQPILGRPLVEWSARRAADMATLGHAVVATDSEEIVDVCRAAGIDAVLTSPDHPSGTDRVAEVAALERFAHFDVIVNLQGDEPLLDGDHVEAAAGMVAAGFDVGTCATPVGTEDRWRAPSVVKVVCAADGQALYFSRAPIPHRRDGGPQPRDYRSAPYLRHLGLYAYRRDALLRWVSLPPSGLETLERLEQLRALEAGMRIGVAVVDEAEPGVDTPEDVGIVETRMRELGLGE